MKVISGLAAVMLILHGCIYQPRTITSYDEKCRIERRHMTLSVHQAATIAGCANDACIAAIALFGIVTAASAVVSGSIVVVGNVVYWFEEVGNCQHHEKIGVPSSDPEH